uniref:DUF2934 domain-containing protein n=1 Tax=Candidatus Kentrum sp. LFY TaxID=2126342 RepID=A0A450WFJ9_9GAMM|nr:MAG: Protein of unknown function (DUF2934) [Candidatus Kentron sp. LFY]
MTREGKSATEISTGERRGNRKATETSPAQGIVAVDASEATPVKGNPFDNGPVTRVPNRMPISSDITPEERWNMIAVAAYYRAEQRGFMGGNPAEDWVAAEEEIDILLSGNK